MGIMHPSTVTARWVGTGGGGGGGGERAGQGGQVSRKMQTVMGVALRVDKEVAAKLKTEVRDKRYIGCKSKTADVCAALSVNVKHGALLYAIRKAVEELAVEKDEDEYDKVAEEWQEVLFTLVAIC